MWHTSMLINSMGVIPISFIFLVYSSIYGILFWDWHLFFYAAPIFVLALIAQAVIAVLGEGGH